MSLLARAGQLMCALPITHVRETMRPLPVETLAGLPAFVLGAAVIRGAPTPVIDLAALLGGGGSPPQRFVTLRIGARVVALAVGEVLGLRRLTGALARLPPLLRAPAIERLETHDAELLVVLDAARLVPDDVWAALDGAGASA